MPPISDDNLLRFACPACGIRLVVDRSIAGTEGPCPSCGAIIQAPPVQVSHTLSQKQAPPVVIKPRKVSSPTPSPVDDAPVEQVDVPAKEPIPASPSRHRKRSVDPNTSLSHKYNEKKNMQAFFKILAATVVVFIIAAAVYYFLKNPPS